MIGEHVKMMEKSVKGSKDKLKLSYLSVSESIL